MKNIEIPDDVYAALARLAQDHGRQPAEILGALLTPRASITPTAQPLSALLLSATFQNTNGPDARYLAVLSWVATNHPADFGEYVEREPSARRYLRFAPHEIIQARRQHLTQQIDGTRYWAIMNIEAGAKRRFLTRLLDFIGYENAATEIVCAAIGLVSARSWSGLRVA